MKELSIKEKARAYDKAIKKAESLYKAAEPMSGCSVIIEILFPELKEESEDDKMMEDIIYSLNQYMSCINNAEHLRPSDKKYWTENVMKQIAWLEKQREQKPIIEMKSAEESLGVDSETYNKIVDECIYGDDKQKHADKVKPKFNVGDWIIYSNEEVCLITGFDDNGYFVDEESYIPFNCEGNMRLFTIQDAKDGDVLAEDTCIFIIKKLNHDLTADIYCCLYDDGDFELNSNLYFDDTCTYPATKEQRDLLFQKMKEAGYGWDEKKKELKKIEQAPAWSEEDEKMLKTDEEMINEEMLNEEMINEEMLKNDEEMLKAAICLIKGVNNDTCHGGFACNGIHKDDVINWLEDLLACY